MTQGDPLSPTIFKVVDALVYCWLYLVSRGMEGPDGWGREVLHRIAFFCTDDVLVASTNPEWIQRAFDTLTWLFDSGGSSE